MIFSLQDSAVATTVPVRLEIVLAQEFKLDNRSLDLSAFTREAITNCMEEAAISLEDTITFSNLPDPLATWSAESLLSRLLSIQILKRKDLH